MQIFCAGVSGDRRGAAAIYIESVGTVVVALAEATPNIAEARAITMALDYVSRQDRQLPQAQIHTCKVAIGFVDGTIKTRHLRDLQEYAAGFYREVAERIELVVRDPDSAGFKQALKWAEHWARVGNPDGPTEFIREGES